MVLISISYEIIKLHIWVLMIYYYFQVISDSLYQLLFSHHYLTYYLPFRKQKEKKTLAWMTWETIIQSLINHACQKSGKRCFCLTPRPNHHHVFQFYVPTKIITVLLKDFNDPLCLNENDWYHCSTISSKFQSSTSLLCFTSNHLFPNDNTFGHVKFRLR